MTIDYYCREDLTITTLKEFELAGTYPGLSSRSPFTTDLSADTGSIFFPYEVAEGHPVYTGVISTGVYLARWEYVPLSGYYTSIGAPGSEPRREEIYLVETWRDAITEFSGDAHAARVSGSPQYELRVDFESKYWHTEPTAASPQFRHPVFLHPDVHPFADVYPPNPGSFNVGHGEYFFPASGADGNSNNLNVTKFGCDFYSQQVAWENAVTWRSCEVRTGRCACWKYYCSDACRCVPEKLCYYIFTAVSGTPNDIQDFKQGQLNWNPKQKSWIDNDIGGTGSGIAIYLKENESGYDGSTAGETYNGFCQAGLSGDYIDSFNFPQGSGTGSNGLWTKAPKCQSVMTFSFDGKSSDSKNYFNFYAYPSFGTSADECERLLCDEASPCTNDCGSHPQSLLFEASGYEAEAEGTPRTCSYSLNLEYFQTISLLEGEPNTIEVECGYQGIDGAGGHMTYKAGSTYDDGSELVFSGPLGSEHWDFEPSGESSPQDQWVLTEECNPYEATLQIDQGGPGDDWIFSDCGFSIDVIKIFITER